MATRRMFSKRIINSGRFLKMPISSQALYFHLGMEADDDGIVEAFGVLKNSGLGEDDLRVLVAKELVKVLNEDLVSFITDWREHNLIRADRKIDSIYKDLLLQIIPEAELVKAKPRSDVQDNKRLGNKKSTDSPRTVHGRHSIGEVSIEEVNINNIDTATQVSQEEEIKEDCPTSSVVEVQQKQGVPQLIKLFEDINPDYEDWFGNTTQRASAEKLLLRAPFNKLEELITGIMPILNSTPYNPKDCKAFSPFELNKNWAKIMAKIKEKSIEAIQDKGRGIKVSGL